MDLEHWTDLVAALPKQSGPYQLVDVDAGKGAPQYYRVIIGVGNRPKPPKISRFVVLAGGQFQIWFNSVDGAPYSLQASEDLVHWSELANAIPSADGSDQFVDLDAPLYRQRFYRFNLP